MDDLLGFHLNINPCFNQSIEFPLTPSNQLGHLSELLHGQFDVRPMQTIESIGFKVDLLGKD